MAMTNWPPDNPAHDSYFKRIRNGPRFDPARAARDGVTRYTRN